MSNNFIEGLDGFRLIILNLGGEHYPMLVKRWSNFLIALWLLLPHAALFQTPPRFYGFVDECFGALSADHSMGVFMLCLAALSWALSAFNPTIQKRGHWWTSCISCVVWAEIMFYLWSKWWWYGGLFLPIHFLGFVPLFTSFFVPIRLSSARRKTVSSAESIAASNVGDFRTAA